MWKTHLSMAKKWSRYFLNMDCHFLTEICPSVLTTCISTTCSRCSLLLESYENDNRRNLVVKQTILCIGDRSPLSHLISKHVHTTNSRDCTTLLVLEYVNETAPEPSSNLAGRPTILGVHNSMRNFLLTYPDIFYLRIPKFLVFIRPLFCMQFWRRQRIP